MFPEFLVQKQALLQSTQRQTRSITLSDELQFECTVIPSVDAFADSFFHRTYKKWNDDCFEH